MDRPEKRKYKRVPIILDLLCHKVGSHAEKLYTGRTVNVSPGGLYFETPFDVFEPGNNLKVQLLIPPTAGLLEFGGRISGVGRVLRIRGNGDSHKGADLPADTYGVAVEFSRPLKLQT